MDPKLKKKQLLIALLLDSKESKSRWSVFRESRGIYAFEFFEVASHALVDLMK